MENQKNSNGVIDNSIREFVVGIIYVLRNLINSVGLILGSITLNLVDVILGGLVLSQLFYGYQFELFGYVIHGLYLGWMLSIVLWYVQLLLWDIIFRDGKLSKNDIPAIALAVLIAAIDTFGDSASVLIATVDSPLRDFLRDQALFGTPLFDILVDTIFVAVIIITGCNEFFNKLLTSEVRPGFFGNLPKVPKIGKKQSTPKPKNTQRQAQSVPNPWQSSFPTKR